MFNGVLPIMRPAPLATAAVLLSLLARQALADEPPPATPPSPPSPVEPRAAPAPIDDARARELRVRLFASESLSLTASGVTRNGVRIDDDSVYRLAGRPDLADRRHHRRVLKGILIGVGATSLSIGIVARAFERVNFCVESNDCPQRTSNQPAPIAMIVGGGLALLTGIVLPSDPVDAKEKHDVVDGYNARLRTLIGLPF